ncbi:MAG: hypothetical protein NT007_02770 [Candidatus Kapabacteria bacterium]|nr:hypothetical protein [Candidatus Kapabacteria bacterium]
MATLIFLSILIFIKIPSFGVNNNCPTDTNYIDSSNIYFAQNMISDLLKAFRYQDTISFLHSRFRFDTIDFYEIFSKLIKIEFINESKVKSNPPCKGIFLIWSNWYLKNLQSNTWDDSTKLIESGLKYLSLCYQKDSILQNYKYYVDDVINFFEITTGIPSKAVDLLGKRQIPTKGDYFNWETWYSKNKDKIYWDDLRRRIILRL